MNGIELILAALAAGAGAGVGDTAKTAVLDAYAGLRDLLRRRVADNDRARQVLDAGPDESGVWNIELAEELAEADVDKDEEILGAARQVLVLADPVGAASKYHIDVRDAKGVQIGDHTTQHNTFS